MYRLLINILLLLFLSIPLFSQEEKKDEGEETLKDDSLSIA